MMLSQQRLTGNRGIRRNADDRLRGGVIEQLLCQGKASVPADLLLPAHDRLAPFLDRGLVCWEGDTLSIAPSALPYARTIAATFDAYRQPGSRRFSSAV